MMTDRQALAWIGVFDGEPDPEFIWWDEAKARRWINTRPGVELAPLVIAPTLTDAEQSLIRRLAAACEGGHPREWTNRALTADDRATLRGLLERLG